MHDPFSGGPLVFANTIESSGGGEASEYTAISQQNLAGSSILAGMVGAASGGGIVLADATSGSLYNPYGIWMQDLADNAFGLIVVDGKLTLTEAQWEDVKEEVGGLVPGERYYLSKDNPGKITLTAPITVGQWVCRVGWALTSTILKIEIEQTIRL